MIIPKSSPGLVVFAYNRPSHFKSVIEQLSQTSGIKDFDLYIFIDGPKTDSDSRKVNEVRLIAESVNFTKSLLITSSTTNKGLANSVISGVSEVLKIHESVIVLEDDIIVSPCFLNFMLEALAKFSNSKTVFSLSGFNYPLSYNESDPNYYLSYRSSSWGWATWADRWMKVDWSCTSYEQTKSQKNSIRDFNRGGEDLFNLLTMQMEGKIDSWSIRFDYAHFENQGLCLHPKQSLVENIGFDGSGTHPASKGSFRQQKSVLEIRDYPSIPDDLTHSKLMQKRFDSYFRPRILSLEYIKRFLYRLARVT